jgi:hypothetical protein
MRDREVSQQKSIAAALQRRDTQMGYSSARTFSGTNPVLWEVMKRPGRSFFPT